MRISGLLQKDDGMQQQLNSVLQPVFSKVFKTGAVGETTTKEAMFSKFYDVSTTTVKEVRPLLEENLPTGLPVRQFVSTLLFQMLKDIMTERAKLFQKVSDANSCVISEQDQSILFYISGYIVKALQKYNKRIHNSNKEVLSSAFQAMLRNQNDTEKTFVSKFAEWTEKLSRGGLRTASDDFFY